MKHFERKVKVVQYLHSVLTFPFASPNSETNTKSLKNSTTNATTAKTRKAIAEDEFMCPKEKQAQYQLFPYGCAKHKDCTNLGKDYRCCKLFGSKRCIEGLPKPIPEPDHSRTLGETTRICKNNTIFFPQLFSALFQGNVPKKL